MSIQKNKKHQTISKPTLIPIKQPIKKVVAGSNHSYAIAEDKIFCWGKISQKILEQQEASPLNAAKMQCTKGKIAIIPIQVTEIATDSNHTFAWSDHEVYCWGSNQFYELGLEEEKQYGVEKMQVLNTAIEKGYRIIGISCGQRHSLAALEVDGQDSQEQDELVESEVYEKTGDYDDSSSIQLYGWGHSQSYQLTLNTTNIIPYPVLSPCLFKHLDKLYSRSDYNMAICNGKVYSWGCNLFSRLGQLIPSAQLPEARIPRLVTLPEKISKIGIGMYHVVAVSSSGSAYSWGKGNLGQLGIDRFQIQSKPNKMACNDLIADVSCGESHTLLLLQDGRLKSCGSNVHGVLGHSLYDLKDKKKRVKKPEFVQNCQELQQISMISSGNNHNIILNKKGAVFGWGSNNHYQVLPWNNTETNHEESSEGLAQRRSLQISIYMDKNNKQNKQKTEAFKAHHQGSALQKLFEWRRRYNEFIVRKRQQQQEFMDELELISGLLVKQEPFQSQ